MPRFAANVSTMFQELAVADRFAAARDCGFKAVEFLHPYTWPIDEVQDWLRQSALELILINTPTGEGEVGLAALPGREQDFHRLFEQTLGYAEGLGVPMIHVLAGRDSKNRQASSAKFVEQARWAADLAQQAGINLLLEPLNTRDVPGYLHTHCDETVRLINDIARSNVRLQFDFYHSQIMGGDLAASLSRHLDVIGHIQFSSVPGRHEPQYGEVNVHWLFNYLDELGYSGWVGCEYTPKAGTRAGLGWAQPWGIG